MNFPRPVWRIVAVCTAAGFFWIATRVDVYNATTPYGLSDDILGGSAPHFAHPGWLSLHLILRKVLSIIAFTIVGFTAERALGPTARPALRSSLLVAFYSLGIEVVQFFVDPAEPFIERIFDVGCGAVGGWCAIALDRRIASAPEQIVGRAGSANDRQAHSTQKKRTSS